MQPADIARVLGVYAQRVITPRGSTAVSGLELMTALRPPTKPERDEETGNWVSGHNPGSLGTEPMDPAPPEATPEHPVVVDYQRQEEEATTLLRLADGLPPVAPELLLGQVRLDLATAGLHVSPPAPLSDEHQGGVVVYLNDDGHALAVRGPSGPGEPKPVEEP